MKKPVLTVKAVSRYMRPDASRLLSPLIDQHDAKAGVEKGLLAQTVFQRLIIKDGFFKDLRVRLERNDGAVTVGFSDHFDVAGLHAALKVLMILPALAADSDIEPFGQRVDDRSADAVQAA